MSVRRLVVWAAAGLFLLLWGGPPSTAGVHLWRVKEIFSNADGSVQFIEIATCCASTTENAVAGHQVRSDNNTFTITGNVAGSTLNKHILLATDGYAALPGAPPRDYEIPANFFEVTADTIVFSAYDNLAFGPGQLVTNGTTSLNKDPNDATDTVFTALNSPTNYAGTSSPITVVSGPPGVPDGTGGSTPLRATSPAPGGTALDLTFDTSSCTNGSNRHILYGQRSGFPAAPGGIFTLMGSVCSIGNTGSYSWTTVPEPTDGNRLIWFLVVATDASFVEGSWGESTGGLERNGPGNNGASGTCAIVKDVANACGH